MAPLEDAAMKVHRLVVRACTGELRAVPVWRSLLQAGLKAGAWKIQVDTHHHIESLSIDIINPDGASVSELQSMLRSSLPPATSVDVL
ncbi:hypothetical protein [Paraburkholderia hospita]|nr:hypothetical protein [Paraburkholderia hospita]